MRVSVLPVVYDTRPWHGRTLVVVDHAVVIILLFTVAVMVGVVSTQVVLRYGFNLSLDWADEISRLCFVWSIFLAIPLGVRQGAHIGIDVVVQKMPPVVQAVLRRGAAALSAAMMFAIAWTAFVVAREQWDEFMSTLDWSVAWFIVPIGLGAFLSALHLLRITAFGPPHALVGGAE